MPNTVTIIGLVGNTIGAYFLATGQMTIGGLLILVMGPVDALDGTMARLRGEASELWGFCRSRSRTVIRSWSSSAACCSITCSRAMYCTLRWLTWPPPGRSWFPIRGRARQSLGLDTKVGILTRMERYIVLAPLLVLNHGPLLPDRVDPGDFCQHHRLAAHPGCAPPGAPD